MFVLYIMSKVLSLLCELWVLLGGSWVGKIWRKKKESTVSLSGTRENELQLALCLLTNQGLAAGNHSEVMAGAKAQNQRGLPGPAQRLIMLFNFCSFCCGQSFQYSSETLLANI